MPDRLTVIWETAEDMSLVSLLPDKSVRSLLAVPDIALSLLCRTLQAHAISRYISVTDDPYGVDYLLFHILVADV